MTDPRKSAVHPHRRRGRHILPFLALALTPLACTDQPTAPDFSESAPKPAASQQHPYLLDQLRPAVRPSMSAMRMSMSTASMSAAVANLSTSGPNVLVLADVEGEATTALATSLADAGFHVGVHPAPEYNWFGTNPPLTGYEVVIHLNGATYNTPLASSAQGELSSFVSNGGGFIGSQWNGYEEVVGQQTSMSDLVLLGFSEPESDSCGDCDVTWTTVTGQEAHPVLEGVPSSFLVPADGHDASPKLALQGDPSTEVLMRSPSGGPGVIVRQVGGGKVVNFGFAPNYTLGAPRTLNDANVQKLYVNAARWLSGTTPTPGSGSLDSDADGVIDSSDNCVNTSNPTQLDSDLDGVGDACDPDDDNDGVLDLDDNCPDVANADQADADGDWIGDACDERGTTPQTITFEPITDKTYGDAPFTVNASASSGLAVTFVFSGNCSMDGATVTITAAGFCTIFAQQTGDDIYTFAQDVERSFTIAKASQTITFAALPNRTVVDPAFTVSATASSGLAVSFAASGACSMSNETVNLTGVGTCTVTAQQAGNSNYHPAVDVARSFAITKLPATITLAYANATFDGTAKLATVTTNPAGLSGVTVSYTMGGLAVAQTLDAGSYQVVATLSHATYAAPQATGTFTIAQATPLITWANPAPISAGTALSSTQLNASATGVGGIALSGTFVYLPAATTVLAAGIRPLSVEFIPNSGNYTRAIKTVSITVTEATSTLKFSGFFRPVHNLPFVNRISAGRTVPVTFMVEGAPPQRAVVGTPASAAVECSAAGSERPVEETAFTAASRMLAVGQRYTYMWKTSSAWAGSCRKLVITLIDGSTHEAHFRFSGTSKGGEGKQERLDPKEDDKRDKGGKGDSRKDDSNGRDKDSSKRDARNKK